MPNLIITNLTDDKLLLNDLYITIDSGESVSVYRAQSDISRLKSLLTDWADNKVSVSFSHTPEEINLLLSSTVTRQDFGIWARENLAPNLTNSPMLPLGIGSSAFAEIYKSCAGSILGIAAKLSETPAGSSLTLKASVNGVASTSTLVMVAAGPTSAFTTFDNPLPYDAEDTIGIMVSTGAGWTSVSLDVLANLIIADNFIPA